VWGKLFHSETDKPKPKRKVSIMEIRKSDIPVIDMFNAEEETKAIAKAIRSEGHGRNIVNLNNYVVGVGVARRVKAGDKAKDIAAQYGVSAATLSKTASVASVALAVADPDRGDDFDDERMNIRLFWNAHWETNPGEHDTLHNTLAGLVGDDGDKRADSLVTMLRVFGAPSSAYQVLKGTHAFFKADNGEDGDDDSEESEESGDDDDKVLWQDRLMAIVAQAKLEGAETADILAVVKAAL
jgi:hypothetical protein